MGFGWFECGRGEAPAAGRGDWPVRDATPGPLGGLAGLPGLDPAAAGAVFVGLELRMGGIGNLRKWACLRRRGARRASEGGGSSDCSWEKG